MQQKKNKRLAFLLLALLLVTAVVVVLEIRRKDQRVDPGLFRLADYKGVNRIVLRSPDSEVELAYRGARWRVNDRYDADRDLISVLFATLQQAEPKRPVSSSKGDSIAAALAKNGISVALFEGERRVQHFYAGGNAAKTQAYFSGAEESEAFVVGIPGYKVYVSGIFELQANQWREKFVFGFNWNNFRDLTAEFPARPSGNYTIRTDRNGIYGIEGMKTDTSKIHTFLDHVSLLTVNEFLEAGPFTDSLKTARPEMVLVVTDVSDARYSLKIFQETGSQVTGLLNENEAVVFSRLKLGPILRPASYFREQ